MISASAKKIFSTLLISIICLLFISHATSFQEKTAGQLFEKALYMEEAQGDLQKAIDLYQKIVKQFPKNREVAAKAQLHIGLCYEKLGKAEAHKAYQRVIEEFGDQHEVVAKASARLAELEKATADTDASGVVVRQVWAPAEDIQGAPSPDGRYLCFTDWETGDLAVRELATAENRRLTNKGTWYESYEFAQHSIFSPDGKQVAYSWYNKDDFADLRIVGLNGSEARILYGNEELEYVQPYDWSPDGEQILAFFPRKDGTSQIVLVSVADGSVSALKTLEWGGLHRMRFSPDGRYIVYDFPPRDDSRERDIFLLAVDGSREIALVQDPADDLLLGWVPDGRWVLFTSDRTGTKDAWVIQVAEGEPQQSPELVKTDIGQIWPMGFTRQGSLYYGIRVRQNAIYIAKLDLTTGKLLGQPTKVIQRSVGSYTSIDWSPDGQYLAYFSSGTGSEKSIRIRSLETGEERQIIPKLPRFSPWGRPGWTPDRRSFLVWGWDTNGRQGIYQIDAEGSDVTAIVQSEAVQWPIWSHDGKTIFYKRWVRVKKIQSILARDLETGSEKELLRTSSPLEVWRGLDLSVDGRQLAFVMNDPATRSQVLKVMPAAGGEPRELLKLQEPEQFWRVAWTRDESQLLFIKRVKGSPNELWRIHVETGETQKMELEMEQINGLGVHPDNQRIAINGGAALFGEVWVMENFLPELASTE